MTPEAIAAREAGADVAHMRAEAFKSLRVDFKKILKEYIAIGFSNIADFVTVADGGELQMISLNRIPKKKLGAVKKIKEKTTIVESKDGEQISKHSTVEYELWDKEHVLDRLTKLGGWEPAEKHDVKHQFDEPLIDIVRKLRAEKK